MYFTALQTALLQTQHSKKSCASSGLGIAMILTFPLLSNDPKTALRY